MKRKIESRTSEPVNKTSKVEVTKKMVDSKNKKDNVIKKKAPLKANVIIELKELQERFDTIENENKRNLETINSRGDHLP